MLVTAVHAGLAFVVTTSSVGAFAASWRGATPTAAARPNPAVSTARPASVGVPPAAFGPAHRVLVVGDSLAESLLPGLETTAGADGVQLFSHAFGGCGLLTGLPLDPAGQPYPFSQACNDSRPGWQTQGVQDLQPDLVLWLGAAWDERDHIVNGTIAQVGTIAGDRIFLQLIDEAAQRLTATGARLVIVTPPPDQGSQLAAGPDPCGAAGGAEPAAAPLRGLAPDPGRGPRPRHLPRWWTRLPRRRERRRDATRRVSHRAGRVAGGGGASPAASNRYRPGPSVRFADHR